MPAFARSMTCLAVVFVLALIGCKADPKQAETAEANESAEKVDTIDERAAAERRLEAAEENVTSRRAALKRFLSSERFEAYMSRAELETPPSSPPLFVKRDLEQTHRELIASQAELRKMQREGSYRPTADEMKMVEQSRDIDALNKQIKELSSVRDRELRKFDGGGEVVDKINEQIDGLQAECRKIIEKRISLLLNAKIEQTALGIELIESEIEKNNQELEARTEVLKETVRMLDEHEQLTRELEEAEQERDEAKRALEAINSSDR